MQSIKDISVQLELKYIQAQNLKIKRIHCGDPVLFLIALGWLDVWFSGGRHNFPSLPLVFAFSLYSFYRSFSPWFNCPFFFAAITIRRCLTATAKPASRKFNGLFLLQALGDLKLVFHWSAAWLSWPLLWWGVKSFQNFRRLKLGLYFCADFLASSELKGYVDLTDSYEIWPKCSLVINAQKCVRLFWFSKYFFYYALSCDEDRKIFNSPPSK